MVATIGFQSVPSGAITMERGQGSAFSATTIDVATAAQSARFSEAKLVVKARPEHSPAPVVATVRPATALPAPHWRERDNAPRGPPHLVLVASPRAPPFA